MSNTELVTAERHILNLSGGKDSTAVAVFMRKTYPSLSLEYAFCDTGKELDETYAYLNRIEASLGIKITRSIRKSKLRPLVEVSEDLFLPLKGAGAQVAQT